MALGDKARRAALDRAAANRRPTVGGGAPGDAQAAMIASPPLSGPLTREEGVVPDMREEHGSDFTADTRAGITARSGGRCEARISTLCGGTGSHKHHRKLRRHGDHRVVNGLDVCVRCHNLIHAYPDRSYRAGMMVHMTDDPALIPVARSLWRDEGLPG